MDAGYLIMRLSQVSSILPLVVGSIFFNRLGSPFKTFYIYIICCVAMEGIAAFSVHYVSNNLGLLYFFTIVEFLLISYVYIQYYNKQPAVKILVGSFVLAFLVTSVWERNYVNGDSAFNNISRPLESFFLVLYTMIFYGISLTETKSIPIWRQPMFWISTGILVFFALNIFYFMLFNLIQASGLDNNKLGILHSVLNIASYVLYAKAFQCFRLTPKYPSS
jgi:hypothetical protein